MANTTEQLDQTVTTESPPGQTAPLAPDTVANAEKIFHRLQVPDQIRSKLGEILDIARERLDQIIITPAERQAATIAHSNLVNFLRGNLSDRGQVLTFTRNLTAVIGKAGDVPLSRAVNAGVNSLLKRQMAH